MLKKTITYIHRLEDGLIVAVLGSVIVLAVLQIILRNIFDSSILWIDPLIRIMVLWLGLMGAMMASRYNKHIAIDLLPQFSSEATQRWMQIITNLVASVVCAVVAYFAVRFVADEYQYSSNLFGAIPSWVPTLIIPISFAVIALRYMLSAATGLFAEFRKDA